MKQVLQQLFEDANDINHMETSIAQALQEEDQEASWRMVLCPSPTVSRMLLAGLGVAFFQQACGSEAMVYYSPAILDEYGVARPQSQNHYTILVGLAKLTGAIIGGPFLDMVGRRPGLIASCVGTATSLGALAIFPGSGIPMIGVASLMAFMILFELGLAPAAFLLGTESYPTAIRAKALSMGMFTTRLLSGFFSCTFPGIVSLLTMQATLGLFGMVALVGALWAAVCVPETRGLSLEEAAKLFEDQPDSSALVSPATSRQDEVVAYGAVAG
jgi:MFS family permease